MHELTHRRDRRSRQADCYGAITYMRVGSKERFANSLLNRMKKPGKKMYNNLLRRLVGSSGDHVM